MSVAGSAAARVEDVCAHAYTVPTDSSEADGTFAWDSTTIVIVEAKGGGRTGIGYTYSSGVITKLIAGKLAACLQGGDVMDPPAAWRAMTRAVRNMGRDGLAATAISAVDVALWDLKAKLLGLPLALLLGRARGAVPIYGSGGFTSYSDDQLRQQLGGWVERDGCAWVKMKVGADPARDPHRVAVAKEAIGDRTLFVDGNGAYSTRQALGLAEVFARDQDVRWFEEPVSSDDLAGLHYLRQRLPPRMELAAGEYGYDLDYFRRMLGADAVDVQQADATRCGGVTASCRRPACAKRITSTYPGIAPRRCICMWPAPRRGSGISNGSMTMSASSTCCSTAPRCRKGARSVRICPALGWGLS